MENLLMYAVESNASDVHITASKESWIRANGVLTKYPEFVSITNIDEFIRTNVSQVFIEYRNMREKRRINSIDGAFKYLNRRFRINIYLGMDGINIALRLLNDKILSIRELFLPEEIGQYTQIKSGLFIVAGTTGSGKSTTLASMIDSINHTRSENILTIEQPIEYIHKSDKSRIEQIEVGVHTESFEMATVSAMRQNPNIILVGEMRDLETIQNAITLAETGHVVYGTIHAKSVTDSFDRIIDVFPAKQQEQIRVQLAGVLKGVLHQILIRSDRCGVVPLVELLGVDDVTAAMILSHQSSNAIRDRMRSRTEIGNVHIADNAIWHIKNERLKKEDVKTFMSLDDFNIVKSVIKEDERLRRGFNG